MDGWMNDACVNVYNVCSAYCACAVKNRDIFIIPSAHNFIIILLNVANTTQAMPYKNIDRNEQFTAKPNRKYQLNSGF